MINEYKDIFSYIVFFLNSMFLTTKKVNHD